MQPLPKLWTQTIVGLNLIREQCVSACFRRIKHIKERGARRLVLVRHVRVPGDGVCPGLEKIHCGVIVGTAMNQVDFWVAIRSTAGGMNVQTSKVGAKI